MINQYIEKLSKLMNSSVVTPYNLLENINLDNYVSIKYFKDNSNILSDVMFTVNNQEIIYRYIFSSDNDLKQIYELNDNGNILVFDRNNEQDKLIKSINKLSLKEINQKCV